MPADLTAAFFSPLHLFKLHFLTLLAEKWAAHAPAAWSWWKGDSLFPLWALHKSRSFLIRICPCAKAGLDCSFCLYPCCNVLLWVFSWLCGCTVLWSCHSGLSPFYCTSGSRTDVSVLPGTRSCLVILWGQAESLVWNWKLVCQKEQAESFIIFLIFMSKLAWKYLSMSLFPY